MAQAPAGGMVGINGDFYAGGQFLPNTELPKRPEQQAKKSTGPRRVMTAPYTYDDCRDGFHPIYAAIVGTYAEVTRDGTMRRYTPYRPNDTDTAYMGTHVVIDDLINQYNSGERWFAASRATNTEDQG